MPYLYKNMYIKIILCHSCATIAIYLPEAFSEFIIMQENLIECKLWREQFNAFVYGILVLELKKVEVSKNRTFFPR